MNYNQIENPNMLESAIEFANNLHRPPTTLKDNARPFALIPEGLVVTDMEKFLDRPVRKSATPQFFDVESLANYLLDQDEKRTRVFASVASTTITGIIDYHDGDGAAWGDHKGVLKCEPSDDWKDWLAIDGKEISQVKFAEFVEDHIANIVEPDAAVMKEVSRNLEVNKSVVFSSGVNLDNGAIQLTYKESIEQPASSTIKVPNRLMLGIQPFTFSKPYAIAAKLRYRIGDGGKLAFIVTLERPEEISEKAFRDVVLEVEKKLPDTARLFLTK